MKQQERKLTLSYPITFKDPSTGKPRTVSQLSVRIPARMGLPQFRRKKVGWADVIRVAAQVTDLPRAAIGAMDAADLIALGDVVESLIIAKRAEGLWRE